LSIPGRTTTSYKKIESPFDYFADPFPIRCKICKESTPRVRTYKTLNSLNHHLATEHKLDGTPASAISEVKEVLLAIAKAKQWDILP